MRAAFVRHGRTTWNAERRLQGRSDLPLDARGVLQAEAAARVLGGSRPWSGVVSSPLLRARQTAAVIARALELPDAAVDDGLVERDYGLAEGVALDEAHRRWPGGDYPEAESTEALAARSAAAVRRLLDGDGDVIVVGHGAFLRAGIRAVTGREFPRLLNGDVVLASGSPPRFQVHAR
ncbi:histidine phosphatase family protein [Rathayibacter sp. VKM Ac-2803]|uniref:histidine phosphatase family protein n=1 Tax=unclassified Rathayibacter TaxID=2609250 RepID=UPI00135792F7|nr:MULTISPECIES: histidine phosphatase family protein [unclassified Rathayibacter]MWV48018.1 histidine phosphatase family protein [Rathayibacter sp. VKM Ac-2803]MWV58758.1 histidine phosphatase family protein [Rathayibacter sp. VKM Ac-2754]